MLEKSGSSNRHELADFLHISRAETEAVIAHFVQEEIDSDERWREVTAAQQRMIKRNALKRRLLGWYDKGLGRSERQVANRYKKWREWNIAEVIPNSRALPVIWGQQRLLLRGAGLRRLYLLRLIRLIDRLRPVRVLDVGCGNGEKLLILACRFPEIEFYGVDLTPEGIAAAESCQEYPELPETLVELAPERPRDRKAHQRICFQQSSARDLPFSDGAMDLIYTSLAIEQMESIRDEALREIARVSAKCASFFEAFREYNDRGLQKKYIFAENYFNGRISDLKSYGFNSIQCFSNFPQKYYMNVSHVLACK